MAYYTTSPSSVPPNTPFTLTWNTGGYFFAEPPNLIYIILTPVGGGSGNIFFGDSIPIPSEVTFNIAGLPYDTYSILVESPNEGYSEFGTNLTTCFVEGSEILCIANNKEEYIKVEDLKIGDLVKVYNNSPKKILYVMKKTFKNDTSYSQIRKLSNYPNQTKDLFLTGGHSILVDKLTQEQEEETKKVWAQPRKIGEKYLLLAYIDKNAEKIEDENEYNVYHIVLENEDKHGQYGIYANGILTETMSIDCYLIVTNSLLISDYKI